MSVTSPIIVNEIRRLSQEEGLKDSEIADIIKYNRVSIQRIRNENGIPTYHFAHVVDDFLMGTTHIVRGEEWLSSAPKHVELFNAFGFGDLTYTYVHTPLIIKKEGNSIRKISKRKDPEASMSYYSELGYPAVAVIESLMTIINSNYEEWHTANPDKSFVDFEYNPQKMSSSGALYDLEKLNKLADRIYTTDTSNSDIFCFATHRFKRFATVFIELAEELHVLEPGAVDEGAQGVDGDAEQVQRDEQHHRDEQNGEHALLPFETTVLQQDVILGKGCLQLLVQLLVGITLCHFNGEA